MAKETKKMENENVASKTAKQIYKIQELKQQQGNIINLDNLDDDAKITVVTQKIVWETHEVVRDGKKVVEDLATPEEKMAVLENLVSPISARIEALERFYANKTYTESKEKALASGNYLTPQIQSAGVNILANHPNFAESTVKQIRERWINGLKAGNKFALTVLDQAKNLVSAPEVGF